MDKLRRTSALLCDLDGVVWLAEEPIPGSVSALSRLEDAGVRVLFITNSSFSTTSDLEQALARIGVAGRDRVVTSARAAALLVDPGENVLLIGGRGLEEEVGGRGARVMSAAEDPRETVNAVMVGLHTGFDYPMLTRAVRAVHDGARLIGANADATYPTPRGEVPGGGAILAAIERATGVSAVVAGKPHEPMARLVRDLLGGVAPDDVVMVGDRVDTDGAFAATMGCRFAHVRSGVRPRPPAGPGVFEDLAAVVDALLP